MTDLYRRELKFALSLPQAAQVRSRVRLFAAPDPHNGPDGYFVHSVYFDTPSDRDYRDKVNGEYRRQKLRLRWYGGQPERFKLELKEKLGAIQRKRSLPLSSTDAEALKIGDFRRLLGLSHPFARELYALALSEGYLPRCLVSYRRRAYCLPGNDTRITFDEDIRSGSPGCPVTNPGWVTLEVKYRNFLLSNIKLALGENLLPQESIGKYGLCRERSCHEASHL